VYKSIAVYIAVFAVSYFGVRRFRRWSLARELIDVPNERSSHTVPTPRGGGLVIAAVSMLAFFIYSFTNGENFFWAYFAGALIVAVISLADDFRTLSPLVRIIFHGFAAVLAVWAYGGFEWFWIPFYGIVNIGISGKILAFLWIVWLINAYNFMDGIDGIAATQSITAGIGWSLIGYLLGIDEIGFFGAVLALSSMGFVMLNWQPAKIFMGDVGSAFLGYSFAVMPLLAITRVQKPEASAIMPWIGVWLVWFFVFDSVFTFLKRLLRGAKVWQPHREHIYQKLVISGLSHSRVTMLYALFSIVLGAVLLISLWNAWKLEKTVLGVVLLETVLLVLIWVKYGAARKTL
jgi:Fuc2NAc and GlcNAc transferase